MAPQVPDIEMPDECQARLNRRLSFLCALLFLCSSVKTRHAPTKTAQCPRHVIPGKDQGPYLHVQHIACEDKCHHHH